MRNALQEQLLKAGLIKDKEIKEAHKQQRREDRRPPPVKGAPPPPPAARTEADRARAAKAERDRGLNAEREARAARKALISQIAQLIDPFRRPHNDGDEVYNFIDGGAVKRIYVGAKTRAALAGGECGIVRLRTRYVVVSAAGVQAVRARAPEFLIVQNETLSAPVDAAYLEHPIPDDLLW